MKATINLGTFFTGLLEGAAFVGSLILLLLVEFALGGLFVRVKLIKDPFFSSDKPTPLEETSFQAAALVLITVNFIFVFYAFYNNKKHEQQKRQIKALEDRLSKIETEKEWF